MQTKFSEIQSTVRANGWSLRSRGILAVALLPSLLAAAATQVELKNLSVNGGIEDGRARLVLEANLTGMSGEKEKPFFATAIQHSLKITRELQRHTINVTFDILQGDPREIPLTLSGEGEIKKVSGENLLDWSVRQETNGTRSLILRPQKSEKPLTRLTVAIVAERETRLGSSPVQPLALVPPNPALCSGYLRVETASELDAQPVNSIGLVPIDPKFLPEPMRVETKPGDVEPLAFRFHGSAYALPLTVTLADPEARRVVLRDFQLQGQLAHPLAAFTLTAIAKVSNPQGGSVVLLSGGVALSELERNADWHVRFTNDQFVLVFDKPGEFPIRVKFNAAVRPKAGWNTVDFRVASSGLQPIVLRGLSPDTQFDFIGAARPERIGSDFKSFLPPDGSVKLGWNEAQAEAEGKLFYAAQMVSQISISPGLMRQVALIDGKVMQGELNRVVLLVHGQGNVTAVQGADLLAWNVDPNSTAEERRLVVQFNQPQKDIFALQVQMQTELGAFPQAVEAMRLRPEGATRFAGHFRVVNQGAVRLEILQATGLSQISPEQFPENAASAALLATGANQRFAFRFASADFALRVNADNVLPELSVSQLLIYHLGETEQAIEAEFELDIREAPLREVLLRVPKNFSVARLTAAGLSDYFLREPAGQLDAELRLVYGQPISDRQLIQLRLEHNLALGQPAWTLPRVEVNKAKSTRGHVAISSDAGFRLTPERTVGLNDIATAFFPRKVAGVQAAFRLNEPGWEATLRVERLPQSIQADVFHLFSIGEGIAYGSSTLNYSISGAPVSAFQIALSSEYFNVEFTGKDVRNWEKTTNGYVVQLNTPVSGNYTLLTTCERPFKAQGETLTFTGARPVDVQSEQGHTLVVSAYQFQVRPVDVSPGLLELETAEVPAEYRLFFDAPILKAYRYTARPFNLRLALSPLQQGETLSLVVDRAALSTRISRDGDVLTDARYFLKNRGNAHLRLSLPEGTTLWAATVNGATVVPVKDGTAQLIPLPQRADPNEVQTLDLKLASRSRTSTRVTALAPVINAPVLLAEWTLEPDTAQRLRYRSGSLAPTGGVPDGSGFAGLARMLARGGMRLQLGLACVLMVFALWAWRWATQERAYRWSVRHLGGSLVGLAAMVLATMVLVRTVESSTRETTVLPRGLAFLAPVQQSGSALRVEVENVADELTFWSAMGYAWPAVAGLLVFGYASVRTGAGGRVAWTLLGWTLVAWAALRWPNGLEAFFGVLTAFLLLQVIIPSVRALLGVPRRPESPAAPAPAAVTGLLLLGGWLLGGGELSAAETPGSAGASRLKEAASAESVIQEIRVEEKFVLATAKIHWQARKGELLPLLFEPGVVTQINYPTNALRVVPSFANSKRVLQVLAQQEGAFDIEVKYQLRVSSREGESGFSLPTQHGLVNRITLTVVDLDVDVASPSAVSVRRDAGSTNTTVATLVLAPVADSWIGWKPRNRDVAREKAVFFAELFQLYVPAAGVIEGVHQVQVRPAQGELSELSFDVPGGATIVDVVDSVNIGLPVDTKKSQVPAISILSLWRFDPDTRKLRVTLTPPQSRPFTLVVRSQVATGPLPFEQSLGLLKISGASGQLGSIGVATGSEVQLDTVTADSFSAINLEDFPNGVLDPLRAQIAALTLRRAFRYAEIKGELRLRASSVEPDVRVETQETLSLSEDRSVLAVNAAVEITRAGIFRLSFLLPTPLDVENLSGPALSHWTELKVPEGRVITLHLKGKTEGQQQFTVNLVGPGTRVTTNYLVPRFIFREAGKQRGQLVIVPEQGMRLQVGVRDGVTQLDPQKSGIRQKGVLAFRLLQTQWSLSLGIEQVDAWVQVTGLQHATVSEAQVKVAANLQYQIENTGLKTLQVRLPINAETVHFRGEQVADFLPLVGTITNAMQTWEVKLHRRIIGKYLLQVNWQTPVPESATQVRVGGVQSLDANLQRGFVTIAASGRLQVRADALPAALQPAEWQAIPHLLLQDISGGSASLTFRLVEPIFALTLNLERHEATKLLPARVNHVTLTSVISDEGVMLTQATLELVPGDKRLLHVSLPNDATFWFAFVNQNGVWPWREQERILIPLEQQSRADQATTVELFYSSRIGAPGGRALDLSLVGPKFDLPLENITWQVYLNEKWNLAAWTGTLQLQENEGVVTPAAVSFGNYLESEGAQKREKTKAAEQMLSLGNSLLQRGDPQQARWAFQNAFGLSTHDNAFNEDARVQLHNLKLQQALVGLNVRQSAGMGDVSAAQGNLKDLRNRKDVAYTQQEAKQIMESNTADDNAVLMRLAERIIQQQDAAVTAPTTLRAAIPQQGRLLTFRRTVQIDTTADLKLSLHATARNAASRVTRGAMLGVLFLGFAFLAWLPRRTGKS